MLKSTLKLFILPWLTIIILGITSAQIEKTDDVLATFHVELSSSKQLLNQLSLEITSYEQWFKDYQSQFLSSTEIEQENFREQLNELWQEIERLETLTASGWLDALSNRLDSDDFKDIPTSEINNWIEAHDQYINQIQADVLALGNSIEQIKQAQTLTEEIKVAQATEVSYSSKEHDVLETTLLYLLAGLENWGSWLEPSNETGLLPEAEGRFIVSSTPILQTGVASGGIGVVGFAQPITISRNDVPEGFSEEQHLYEIALFGYDDHIEDVFEPVSYIDRLNYQYGVEVDGRVARVYRKPIEIELTLFAMLQKLGAPPEIAEVWVTEYAEIAHLPQSIQLSWLIAGNPLAKDYQSHIENTLEAFDLNALLTQGTVNQGLPSTQTPNTQWVSQDPFWEEVQKQPLFNAFLGLLGNTNEEIRRSFIVSLFFLEPSPLGVSAAQKINNPQTNNGNIGLRPKPFFWSDAPTVTSSDNPPASLATELAADPDQSVLVAEALRQKKNLIQYWMPSRGKQVIPWSQRNLLNPNDKGTPYFIMAVTALPQFAPKKLPDQESNYGTIVNTLVNNHLPENQPVLKIFTGSEVEDRKAVDSEGLPIYFFGKNFLWTAEKIDNDVIMQYASNYHSTAYSPYTVISIQNGLHIAGPSHQIKGLFKDQHDYTVENVILRAKGNAHYKNTLPKSSLSTSRKSQASWLSDASKVAQSIFSWPSLTQDKLFIQSSSRFVEFEKKQNSDPEIKTSSMVVWKNLPVNEEILSQHNYWGVEVFLMQSREGYFFIPTNELEYLQAHADEKPQIHTLVSSATRPRESRVSIQRALQNRNLDCESIRVLSATGLDLAYSPSCLIVIEESGWELAQANEQAQIRAAKKIDQPIVIFRSEDKSPSALPLNTLFDAEQSSIEGLQVSTLVPIYNLEGLDTEEWEDSISTSIIDSIGRTLQFFPKQKEFEVLLPKIEGVSEQNFKHKYSSVAPDNFEPKYVYDTIEVSIPTENEQITFYGLRETTVTVESTAKSEIELVSKNILMPSGEWNKDHVMELAQDFFKTHSSPYFIVQTSQNKFYGGSLGKIKDAIQSGEHPKGLALMVTRLGGTEFGGANYKGRENSGWLGTTPSEVIRYSNSLQIDPDNEVTVWSSKGKRQAVFTADGSLQIEQMVQWQTRPDNKTLESLRKAWRGNILLVHIPNQGYLLAQPNEARFLADFAPIKVDSLVLSSDMKKKFADIASQTAVVLKNLPAKDSVRVLSSYLNPNSEEVTFYDGIDLAFYLDNQEEVEIDLQRSGLELAEQTHEQWLSYAEAKNSPLVVFQWPDSNKSLALLNNVVKMRQSVIEAEPQFLVPAYSFEGLDESTSDQKEIEESIAITLQDTLQRVVAFWPNQTSFQIVMPHEKDPRLYSQDAPSRVQSDSLGMIEVTRQSDNTKIKYYYRP